MLTHEQGTGEKARVREDRADLEMLLALVASESARKRSSKGRETAPQLHLAARPIPP